MADVISKTLSQLLTEERKREHYIIPPLLPVGGILVISGAPKTFKSFLALNLAYSLSSGQKFLEYWEVKSFCSVLYIEMEVGEYELIDRETRIHGYRKDPNAADNLRLISKDMRIQLDTPEGLSLLNTEITTVRPRVVIIDPLVEFHSQEENSAIIMKRMLWPFRQILQSVGAALVIVHHNAKTSEFRTGADSQSVRGSYIAGVANTVINIQKPVQERDERIRLNFTLRSAKAPRSMNYDFDETTGGFRLV